MAGAIRGTMEADMVPMIHLQRPRLLLVDDDERLAAVVAGLLDIDGYEVVRTITRATEVVAAVAETDPDLIVLDLVLPDGDGLDVADELRATGYERPIVVFSSLFDHRVHATSLSQGYGYVEKVEGLDSLEAAIEEGLDA